MVESYHLVEDNVLTVTYCAAQDGVICYPDMIKIPMEDGQVISYIREIEQPHPKCLKSIELIKIMNSCTFGGTKPRRRNKNGR
jgi:hypothetical protein